MDEQVLRGLAKWPNVPSVFGWLSLDRRGNWLLRGESITNPVVTAFISRNYERDAQGRWFFQNGPQRVYLELEYTPFIYRALNPSHAPLSLQTHTGLDATGLSGAWIDENGSLLVESEHGVGIVHDKDLEVTLPSLVDEDGTPLTEEALEEAMAQLQQGECAAIWITLGATNVQVEPARAAEVPQRFGFVAHPGESEQAPVAASS